jgi:hypothetical protein
VFRIAASSAVFWRNPRAFALADQTTHQAANLTCGGAGNAMMGITRRLCSAIALIASCSGCTTPVEKNVCQPKSANPGSYAYFPQCSMSNDQLQILLSQPAVFNVPVER